VKFGIMASHQYLFEDDLQERLAELWDIVEHAAELGYDSVWAINHFLGSLNTPQPISMMAKLIDHSGDMQIGSGILILPLFNPVHVAEEFATLDQLSRGRIILGVGAGYRTHEFESLGVPMERRGRRLDEGVRLIKALWSGERVSFEGEFYTLDDQRIGVLPYQSGGPPVFVGAGSIPAVRRAARIGDAWYAPGNSPNPVYLEKAVKTYDDALAEYGRADAVVSRPVGVELYCAPTGKGAWDDVLPFVKREYHTYGEYEELSWQRDRFDELVVNTLLIGSPDELIARIQRFADLGFDHLIFRPWWLGMPAELAKRSLSLFASEVMPAFAESKP
jgi:alkanesulfonate monooxygenase SsuD/methylene tetrahydromethanopterin reductase-like flavin-dependent oxidoreductase (luciferase family)